jgi:hypothetical protein
VIKVRDRRVSQFLRDLKLSLVANYKGFVFELRLLDPDNWEDFGQSRKKKTSTRAKATRVKKKTPSKDVPAVRKE